MNFRGWSSFEDFIRACGYASNSDETMDNDSSTGKDNKEGCFDIPNGFQCLHPELFVIIGTILGQVMAGSIPSNVQGALGSWLQLIGHVIETYNAQQQYFQEGPGRYFDPKNYNIDNEFCNQKENDESPEKETRTKRNSSKKNNIYNQRTVKKIDELEGRINDLMNEIDRIKNIINVTEKNKP